MVGGFLLAGPFVVTEEVWDLAGNMSLLQTLATVSVVFGIGYATLYKADTKRNQEGEQNIAGVPLRFLSLMAVSFGSVAILAVLFDAPDTFIQSADTNRELVLITFKAVSLSSVFSVVGAATADTLFSR
jgi:uncharacterized membrane protein